MKNQIALFWISVLFVALAWTPGHAEPPAFAKPPSVRSDGDAVRIAFAVAQPADVTVEILSADGTNVVRHLASGMLGPHAPAPFKPNTLEQTLTWDRKDDAGKPVSEPARVRVSLGLRIGFDRFLEHDPRGQDSILAIAPGLDGELLLYQGVADANRFTATTVMALDSEGRFKRQLYPPPAALVPEKTPGLPTLRRADGVSVPVGERWSGLIPTLSRGEPLAMAVAPNGDTHILGGGGGQGVPLVRLGPNGEVSETPLRPLLPGYLLRHAAMASSPDGRFLYAVGTLQKGRYDRSPAPLHAVLRLDANGSEPATALFGDPETSASGSEGLDNPVGVAVDGQGLVYVADRGNKRIAVIRPDGTLLRSVPAEQTGLIQVSKDGLALYVLGEDRVLRKHAPDGALLASAELKPVLRFTNAFGKRSRADTPPTALALVEFGARRKLWVAGYQPSNWYVTAYGLVELEDIGERFGDPRPHDLSAAGMYRNRSLGVHWPTETVFVGASGAFRDMIDFWNGPTGARLDKPDRSVAPTRGQWTDARGYEYRYAARGGNPNHLKEGESWWIGVRRFKNGQPAPYAHTGTNTLQSLAGGTARNPAFNKEIRVLPSGDVYVVNEYPEQTAFPFGREGFRGQTRIDHWSPEGKLVASVTGLTQGSRNLRVLRDGSMVISDRLFPWDVMYPAEIESQIQGAAASRVFADYGAIVKFPPEGGRMEYGKRSWSRPKATSGARPTVGDPDRLILRTGQDVYIGNDHGAQGYFPVTAIRPPQWVRPGVSPVPQSGRCICTGLNFDTDEHDRIWAPDYIRALVLVLDANGNKIARFGGYGNLDSRGPNDSAVLDPQTGRFRPRSPDDPDTLVSPMAGTEIPMVRPEGIAVSSDRRALYLLDAQLKRVLRLTMTYAVEQEAPVPERN